MRNRDDTLTRAFARPSTLQDVDSDAFFREYERLAGIPNQPRPGYVILIGEEVNKKAVDCLLGVWDLILLAVNIASLAV